VRTIILAAAISLGSMAPATADVATVKSGVKTEITTHMRYDSRCRANPVAIKVVDVPANGTVTSEMKVIVVPAQPQRGVKQQSPCVGKRVEGVAVFYESAPGFTGQDQFRYQRLNARDPGDKFNQEIHYIVIVE
jgi:hypothetical protein